MSRAIGSFESKQQQDNSLFSKHLKLFWGPPSLLLYGVKRPECETDPTLVRLEPKFIMRGATPLLSTYTFLVCTGNTVPLLIYLLTHSTEHSPSWEANLFSASQEIPRILWNPKVLCLIHKYPPPVPIPSQLDPVHSPTSYFLKIQLNIILPSKPGSPKWSLSFRFPHQNPVYTSPLPPFALHATPISFFSILSPEKYWVSSTDH